MKKTIVITGASRGIGKAIAIELAGKDTNIVINCVNNVDKLNEVKSIIEEKFKELGHVNVQMPLLIPESMLEKEGELVNGFAPEVAWVTMGGSKQLDERLAIRPTSETMFSDYYSAHVKSYKDLPMLYNQWCSVLRWEKETRPFLRSREFLWQEGHTIHSNEEEAKKEANQMIEVYNWFHNEILAIPSIMGRKTEKEKFSGAEYTLTNEALMYNGVALQSGTSHYFGQKFSEAYGIKFTNKENKEEHAKEIQKYEEARDWLKSFYQDGKMTSLKTLTLQKEKLQQQIASEEEAISSLKEKLKDLDTADQNVDAILQMQIPEPVRSKTKDLER